MSSGWNPTGWDDDFSERRDPQPWPDHGRSGWDPWADTQQPPEQRTTRPGGWGFSQVGPGSVWVAAGGGAVAATGLGLLVLLLGGVLVAMILGGMVLLGAGALGAAWLRGAR